MARHFLSRALVAAAAVTSVCAFATSAQAALAVCANSDISPSATTCTGFFSGNLLSNSPADITAQTNALATLGLTWDGNFNSDEKLDNLNGSHSLDFSTLLQGVSYIGIHFGNGQGGPGNGTAFYKIDAGTGLDVITLAYNASSDAVLYSTTPTTAVPEPATWGLMIVGFGAVGAMLRRRRRVSVTFA